MRRIVCDLKEEAHFLKSEQSLVAISPEQSHHLINVLRAKKGEQLEIISRSTHRKYLGVLESLKENAVVKILSEIEGNAHRSYVRTLLFALCKGEKNDLIAEKACELGVENLIIWQARHSVVKIKTAADAAKKVTRWNKLAESAAKQCGNQLITKVAFAADLNEAIDQLALLSNPKDKRFCCSLSPTAPELRDMKTPPTASHIIIGPEGDFSEEEDISLQALDFTLISLGPHILRAETAAIAAVSAVNSLWGYSQAVV